MYTLIKNCFKNILDKSSTFEGRFYILPKYGKELNTSDLEQVNTSPETPNPKAGPLVAMMPPISFGKYQSNGSTWARSILTLFFLRTSITDEQGNVRMPSPINNYTVDVVNDWNEMHECAVDFIKTLDDVLKNSATEQGIPLINYMRIDSTYEVNVTPVSYQGQDRRSGVKVVLQVKVNEGCDITDYSADDIALLTHGNVLGSDTPNESGGTGGDTGGGGSNNGGGGIPVISADNGGTPEPAPAGRFYILNYHNIGSSGFSCYTDKQVAIDWDDGSPILRYPGEHLITKVYNNVGDGAKQIKVYWEVGTPNNCREIYFLGLEGTPGTAILDSIEGDLPTTLWRINLAHGLPELPLNLLPENVNYIHISHCGFTADKLNELITWVRDHNSNLDRVSLDIRFQTTNALADELSPAFTDIINAGGTIDHDY